MLLSLAKYKNANSLSKLCWTTQQFSDNNEWAVAKALLVCLPLCSFKSKAFIHRFSYTNKLITYTLTGMETISFPTESNYLCGGVGMSVSMCLCIANGFILFNIFHLLFTLWEWGIEKVFVIFHIKWNRFLYSNAA